MKIHYKYKRSSSTRNEEVQTYQKNVKSKLSPMSKRVNLSRIDGHEFMPQIYQPSIVKPIIYPQKIMKQINIQDDQAFNTMIQGFFIPTPRRTSLQLNKLTTEPAIFQQSPKKKLFNLKNNVSDDDYDIDKQLSIPQKIRLHFSCQKLQKRLFRLQDLLSFISIKQIIIYINEQPANLIDYIAEFDLSYKQSILTEILCVVLFFMMKYKLILPDQQTRLNKIIMYQHYQNVCNVMHNLQIYVNGFKAYMHQFFQLQQACQEIPNQTDKLNKYIDNTIDEIIKNITNQELQQSFREYLFMKIQIKTIEFFDKLKQNLQIIQQHLYFLPKSDQYTLVIDLEDTLIYKKGHIILKRPGLNEFFKELNILYDIVIFSHYNEQITNDIVNLIDPNGQVKFRLNKSHLISYDKIVIKDLQLLGRSLNKLIIIDNDPFNFLLSPQNGIQVKTWQGEEGDRALFDLKSFLGDLRQFKDVRIGLQQLKTYSQYFFINI